MKWVTREKVKVDRVACSWLVKKVVDLQAEFVFLPHDTDWTQIRDGIVYDVPGCELGHHGEDVSFDSILNKYKLTDPYLRSSLKSYVRSEGKHRRNEIAGDCMLAGHARECHGSERGLGPDRRQGLAGRESTADGAGRA